MIFVILRAVLEHLKDRCCVEISGEGDEVSSMSVPDEKG
jgi:hypothetical protein